MQTLLTGSTGFLGKIILQNLPNKYSLITLGRKNTTIIANLATQIPTLPKTELVIHAAGKAHIVPKTPAEKQDFFDVNVTGTQNLLTALEKTPPKAFVFISSVAVYGLNQGLLINENTPLKSQDAYGQSKIQAEELVSIWCKKHHVICTILRLPLLVAENPPGNLGAMIKGIKKGYYFNIASGLAKKSMVMASDVAKCIKTVAPIGGIYNLTDGYHPNFKELSLHIATQLNKKQPNNIPNWLAVFLAKVGDLLGKNTPFNSYKLSKIKAPLTFDDSKARNTFGWQPQQVLQSFSVSLL